MERRIHRRFPRRVEIRFWRHGEPQSHSSFTTNISRTGLFLGSASSLLPGERLRLEIVDQERGFMVEAKVARVHRVSIALRHVEQPGVGVRFLPPEELVEELLPPMAKQAGPVASPPPTPLRVAATWEPTRRSGSFATPAGSAGSPTASPPVLDRPSAGGEANGRMYVRDTNPSSAEIWSAATASAGGPSVGPPGAAPTPPASPMRDPRQKVIPVTFDDTSSFLSVFHRDIQSGGLFVSSAEPAALNEVVWIELHLPIDNERPGMLAARVVQRFEPRAAVGEGRNLLGGMAVQFLDPERVVADLKPLLARLRR